jgi:radical SAM enzyme (TIGR01210 family)
VSAPYPGSRPQRDRWILERRGPRRRLDPALPYARIHEEEPDDSLRPVPVSTIFLTNRECPWRCLMCDLWRDTLTETVPAGAIPGQIRQALARLPLARWVKLYNAGSFFDRNAIPQQDHGAIAATLSGFERVIVESHPALIGKPCFDFRDALEGSLEVAMGLETVHPEILPRLNKGMTLHDFRRAAASLADGGISVRAFVLVGLPFIRPGEALEWACRSVEFAFGCGASVVSLIPTRPGNGALDDLARRGEFSPPHLSELEDALAFGLSLKRGRVLADLWDLPLFARCPACRGRREERLRRMNLTQAFAPKTACPACGFR